MRTAHDAASCLLCALAEDVAKLTTLPHNEPFDPRSVRGRRRWDAEGTFDNFQQHDVHEAFTKLLLAVNEVDLRAARALGIGPVEEGTSTAHTTPFWKIFGALVRQTTRCASCNRRIVKVEMFTGFSLPLPRTGQPSVEDLLTQFFGDEPLEDHCACGAPRGSRTKHTELVRGRSPEVLVLQLKRWIWTHRGQRHPEKNPIHVSYETLLPLPGEAVYELRSVVIHDGPAGSGHYFCYVRGWDNFWYLCNDRQAPVRQARVESVLNQRPYMLVYEKR